METVYYCGGGEEAIRVKLRLSGRDAVLKRVQLSSVDAVCGLTGWSPEPLWLVFPTCPVVGDVFAMRSRRLVGGSHEGVAETRWWKVVARSMQLSGPDAVDMQGIVHLLVDIVEGPWDGRT